MKRLHFTLLVLLLSAALQTLCAQNVPKWLKGDWFGVGYQLDGQIWDVRLRSDHDKLFIDYPTLGCKGHWNIIESDRSSAIAMEKLEDGTGKCDMLVRVRITKVTDNELNLSFLAVVNGVEQMVAFSNVVKRGKATNPLRIGIYRNL